MSDKVTEIRCSTKKNASFYAKASKDLLLGSKGKTPLETIDLVGLGSAISICVGAVSRLTSSGVATVENIETGFPVLESQDKSGNERGIASVRVRMHVNPANRKS
jgi:hypothetical protein